jgi:hypothetical protein
MPNLEIDNDDLPIVGAEPIAKALKLPLRKTYYFLERGLIDADKFGRQYVTTLRRLKNQFAGRTDRAPDQGCRNEPA